jgi:mannose-6-phosphate isomerase
VIATFDDEGRPFEQRPWGSFTVLDNTASDYQVKRLVVNPGMRFSYQTHQYRAEHWYFVAGDATVTLDGQVIRCGPGTTVEIPIGAAHRCENLTDEPVIFVEIQTGSYFGEDDIVRLEDDFGRC